MPHRAASFIHVTWCTHHLSGSYAPSQPADNIPAIAQFVGEWKEGGGKKILQRKHKLKNRTSRATENER